MKKYTVIQTYTAQDIWKNVEAKNERQALKKVNLYDPKNDWTPDYDNVQVLDREVEEVK